MGAADILQELVPVPEWGGEVAVRGMSGAELDQYQAASVEMRGQQRVLRLENLRARLLVTCMVDAAGRRLFTPQDVRALGEKSAAALERVAAVARRLSGLTGDDEEEEEGDAVKK